MIFKCYVVRRGIPLRRVFFVVLLTVLLCGCAGAGKLMEKTAIPTDIKLESNQAALIFIRSSAQFSAPIAEYKDKNVSFIGNSTSSSIIMHITDAGKHEYVIAAGRGTILQADLKPGMFYYVYLLPGSKDGKAILYCEPYEPGKKKQIQLYNDYVKTIDEYSVRNDSRYFVWQKNTQEGYAWFEGNVPSFISKYNYASKVNNIYEITADMGVSALVK